MNSIFLPKELNKKDGSPICYDIQSLPIRTDIHWHNCAEIIHMQSGEALIFINEKWETLSAGETVFLPPGHLHCCHCATNNSKRIVIGVEDRLIPYFGNEHALALLPFKSETVKKHLIIKKSRALDSLFLELENQKTAERISDKINELIIISKIYSELLNQWESLGLIKEAKAKSATVSRIEEIIETRFNEPLEAHKIAKELNISYSYLATLLHKELNTSFVDLLLKTRIDAAKKLLLTTDLSITDIALESGFTDSSYFIKKFRAYNGITPLKYRSENLNVLINNNS